MKKLVVFLIVFSMALMSSIPSAWAEGDGGLELHEQVLEAGKVQQNQEKLTIEVGDRKFQIESYPNAEHMRAALGLHIPEEIRKQMEARGEAIVDVDPLEAFKSLSAEKQLKFQNERKQFLTQAARVLNSTKYVLGAGSLVGNFLSFVTVKVKQAVGKKVEVEPKEQRSFRERSQFLAEKTLQSIDYKLWSQAPLVIDSNEFGVQAQAGIVAVQGVGSKGGGGGEFLGVSFAYNKESKAFVFEIHHTTEVFESSKMAVGVIGLTGFAGISMARKEALNPVKTLKGQTFYPPMVPAYSAMGPEMFSAGASTSIGLPPPPLADILTWTDKFERRSLVRITVSPVMKGFVRLYIGDVKGVATVMVYRVKDVFDNLWDKMFPLQRRACRRVFTS